MNYTLETIRVPEFKSGPRKGQRKPIVLPDGAIPLGLTTGFVASVHCLVPVVSAKAARATNFKASARPKGTVKISK